LPRLAAEQLANNTGGQGGFQNANANGNDVNFDILADYRPLPIPVNGKSEEEKPAEPEKTAETRAPGKRAKATQAPTHPAAKPGRRTPRPVAPASAGKAQHP